MKIVFYNESNEIVEVFENIENPTIKKNDIEWDGGALKGNHLPFLLLEDDVVLDKLVTPEILALDKKVSFASLEDQFEQKEKSKETRFQGIEMAIMNIMDRLGKLKL